MTGSIQTLQTPALMLDLDILEKNIADMAAFAKANGLQLRPHIKTHKSVEIAQMQERAGAVGITCATVEEAEVMVEGGIGHILLAFPLVTEDKLARIEKLRAEAEIILTIDSMEQANIVAAFFADKKPIEVWIKVNCGLNRVGVEPNEPLVALATHLQSLTSLRLTGIFTHAGHAYGAASLDEVRKIADEEVAAVVHSAALCEAAGMTISHRSIGSTPTFKQASSYEGITEIRPGNAAFYDMVQVGLGVAEVSQCALRVVTTVASKRPDRLVIDAGSKTLALDRGAHGNDSIAGHGFIPAHPSLIIERLSEEHGVIPLEEETDVQLGDKLVIVPNHSCVVANLFATYHLVRSGKLVDTWPVSARRK